MTTPNFALAGSNRFSATLVDDTLYLAAPLTAIFQHVDLLDAVPHWPSVTHSKSVVMNISVVV